MTPDGLVETVQVLALMVGAGLAFWLLSGVIRYVAAIATGAVNPSDSTRTKAAPSGMVANVRPARPPFFDWATDAEEHAS